MRKRLLSILLVVAMVCTLLPMAVFAADTGAAPAGSATVAVPVYGKFIADIINDPTLDLQKLSQKLKTAAQDVLAGAKIPDVDMVLVSDDGYEYPLVNNGASDANFLTSLSLEATGMASMGADAFKTVQDFVGKIIQAMPGMDTLDSLNQFYKLYGAENVPAGEYTLKVKAIRTDGYVLIQPESGSVRVNVVDGRVNYVGYKKVLAEVDVKQKLLDAVDVLPKVTVPFWGEISARRMLENAMNGADGALDALNKYFGSALDRIVPGWYDLLQLPVVTVGLPGVFLTTRDPGFSFTSADFGGNPLPGCEFLMVNREETEKIVKAAVALGQETFQNAMSLVGSEGFTWDELNFLKADIVAMDEETQQLSFNPDQIIKLLGTYWALFEASANEPFNKFMSAETDLRLPAILKAVADENGLVTFNEDSNITLTWSVQLLIKMGHLTAQMIEDAAIPEGMFENESLQSVVELILKVSKVAAKYGEKFIDESGEVVTNLLNDWVYYLLMNDDLASAGRDILERFGMMDEDTLSLLDLLPTHALLTAKMPTGHYILFETKAPEGFTRSPLFYTVVVTWNTESEDVRDWCYVNVANLGIIGPYIAEDLYTTVRTTNFVAKADELLNQFTGALLQNILTGKVAGTDEDFDLSALAIAYQANLIYNSLGGKNVYESEEACADALAKYLYAHGRTYQNMLMFGHEVAVKSKAVITSEITPDWMFYTPSTSIRTNIALKAKAIGQKIADGIYAGDSKLLSATKDVVTSVVDKIDTTNHIQPVLNQIQAKVNETAKTVVTKTVQATTSAVKGLLSRLFK